MQMKSKKRNPKFEALLRETVTVDAKGDVKVKGMYASTYINFCFEGGIISVPISHVVWFMTHGRWPDDDKVLDHLDDDSMNNAADNLDEITHAENQAKRRNRIVSRSYGKGKYGHGFAARQDKRDGRFYVTRTLSRGHHNEQRTIKQSFKSFVTLEEAEARIAELIAGL